MRERRSFGDGILLGLFVNIEIALVIFTGLFALIVGIITACFISFNVQIYGTVLGLLSLSIEATLGFPQLISNQKNRSVDGLSIFMVVTWFVGDFLKTIYFVVEVSRVL